MLIVSVIAPKKMKLLNILTIALLLFHGQAWAMRLAQHGPEVIEALLVADSRVSLDKKDEWLTLEAMDLSSVEGLEDIEVDGVRIMQDIERIRIDYNQLNVLPDSIGNLTKLVSFNLRENQLIVLPNSFGNSLTRLMYLNLGRNLLSELPDSIGNLTRLVSFNLSANRLIALPDSIGNLTNLQELFLDDNHRFTALPESIGNLKNLRNLRLNYTRLKTLPASSCKLTNLQELGLYATLLSPQQINMLRTMLPNLIVIHAGGLFVEREIAPMENPIEESVMEPRRMKDYGILLQQEGRGLALHHNTDHSASLLSRLIALVLKR